MAGRIVSGSAQAGGAAEPPARLDLIGLSIGYNGQPVVRDITAQIPHGARVAVVDRTAPASLPSSRA